MVTEINIYPGIVIGTTVRKRMCIASLVSVVRNMR